jgi:phosphonate transport system ATP-binding protein
VAVVVELGGAGVRYGARDALVDVDLVVEEGERVAVIGPSGAGKSTLLGLLNGTVAATAGTVRVLGRDVRGAAPRALRAVQARVGTVHQRFDLVGELKVVHNVNAGRLGSWGLVPSLLSLLRPREVDAARAALARVGLADRLDQRTASLSGGEQQRVAIARVLRQEPDLLLADEPVASLDPARGREVVDLLRELGPTLVTSLHDVGLALGFERVVGLRRGRVVFDAAPQRLAPGALEALYALDHPGPPRADAAPARTARRGC